LKKGLVSVFIPSYNYQRYLGDAIDSILAQTYADWELIIVDDASADDSPAIIQRYQRRYPERIRSTLLQTNVGQSEATNVGLRQAQGEFVALLAADDVARPERLTQGVELLRRRPEVAAAFSKVAYIDGDRRPMPVGEDVFNRPFEDMRWQLLEGNFLCGTSIVARLAAIQAVGGYNRNLGYVEDYDLWLRLLDRYELVRVDDVWVDYRLHGENLSFAASRGQQRFGPLYESVAVALRAMHRWPLERLHRFRHRPGSPGYGQEAASVQLRLAECCLRLERSFLDQVVRAGHPSLLLGVSAAYGFLLDALQNDPDNAAARTLLPEVYRALGDRGRAGGGKSSTLGELAAVTRPPVDAPEPPASDPAPAPAPPTSDYATWLRQLGLTRVEAAQYDQLAAAGGLASRFHLAVCLPPGQEAELVSTLKSLTVQLHGQVMLTVVAASAAPAGFAGDRLRWLQSAAAPLAAVNVSLIREEADWVGLIGCGDRLADTAMLLAASAIGRHPDWQAVYLDDDQAGASGELEAPRLKPDFDATLARNIAYTDGLVLVRRDVFATLGGFDPALGDGATHDLLLRVGERSTPPPVGHLAGPLLHRRSPGPAEADRWRLALERHLSRSGSAATIEAGPIPGSLAVRYPVSGTPLVSLIIPTRDRLVMLSRCLESLLGQTAYGQYEIIVVDHASVSQEAAQFLTGLAGLGEDRLRVLRREGAFSLAALFNAGARAARGSHLIFLHDDVAALHPEWLAAMLGHAQRPGIGAVGARLLAADGRLQHAGIVLGLSGLADLVGGGAALDEPGEMGRYVLDQEVSAASAACLLVRREAFEAVGGFREDRYPALLPDVDLCLRLGQAGWRIVWTPQATLLHDGPLKLTEGLRSAPWSPAERAEGWARESDHLLTDWLPQLAADPHYSRLYSLRLPAFRRCEDPLLARDPLPWRPLPRLFAQPADRQACGHYRVSAPLRALATAGQVQGWDTMDFYSPVEMARIDPDTIILQRPYTDAQLAFLEQTARYSRSLRLFDLDDLITLIPARSVHRGTFPADLGARLKRAAGLCDRLVVSTEPLAKALATWHADIRVVPNRLPKAPWQGLAPRRRTGARPRVGWAGALGHEGDLALVAEVMAQLADEVDWVLLGHCPDGLRKQFREIHPPVAIADYPGTLAALNLDVAIAPLEINAFNEAKSNLKLLEYGALGYPVVCSDIVPYQGTLPVTRVANRPKDWISAIRALALDPVRAAQAGDALRDQVLRHWLLEDHMEEWAAAWLP
jgi:GT2 family glycosyltransferase/glycosyltransferase involved in cell wall biosynthesis